MVKIGGVSTHLMKIGKNWPKIGFPGGPPGKVLFLKKSAAKLGGFFGIFPKKWPFLGVRGGRGQNLSSKRNKHCIAAKLIFIGFLSLCNAMDPGFDVFS